MSFWNRLFGSSTNIEQPPNNSGFIIDFKGNSKVLKEDFFDWYKTNPIVFTAINERAKAVANCKFFIKNKDGELIENEITDKLNKPNKHASRNEFLMQLMTYKGIWGTGYIYFNKLRLSQDLKDTEILNIPANRLSFDVTKYSWKDYDYLMNELKFIDDSEIKINYLGINSDEAKELNKDNLLTLLDSTVFSNPYYSESRLKALRYIVSNIQAGLESENTFLSTPGGMGMLVPDNKDASGVGVALREDEAEEIEKQLQQDYGSLSGQRNIRIINSPTKYIPTMVDFSKLKISESVIQNALIIFGAYGLPKELLTALVKGSTFENQTAAYKNYIQNTAQNEANTIAEELTAYIKPKEGVIVASFDHLPIMQEDEKEREEKRKTKAETLKINKEVYDDLLERGLITLDEYKQKLDL